MKQVSLRLPDDLHAAIKASAEREHRSLHGQIVHILGEEMRETNAIPPSPERDGPLTRPT